MTVLNERMNVQAISLALLTAVLWGGNSIAIKLALVGIPPLALAGLRFLLGGLIVVAWARILGVQLNRKPREKAPLRGLALVFIAQIYLLNAGTNYTLGGRSTILISTYPFFTATFAHFFLKGDRLSTLKILGMILSLTGVVLIFVENLALSSGEYLLGDLMVLTSAVLLGARQVYLKHLTQDMHPAKVLIWQTALSLPVFFVLSVLFENQESYSINLEIAGAVLYQGLIIAGFCFMVLTTLLRRHRASRISVFGFITPVIGVLLSSVLLDESLSTGLLSSMILVGAGIAIVNYES